MTRRTPLYDEHIRLKGKMVDFAGWEMPVQYTGVIDEHRAVRTHAGIFDVSHMGQIEFTGPHAEVAVQYLTTNDVKAMTDGRAQYSVLCNERGTVVDDVIVYRFSRDRYILVVNASNVAKDFAWFKKNNRYGAELRDRSDDFALIAFQGPSSLSILQRMTDIDMASVATYHFAEGSVAGKAGCIVAKTGYTGEEGVEIFTRPGDAASIWRAILSEGESAGVVPIGLGARDTLRLEMKYSLYGHEITEETNPIEAGLSWVVKLDTPDDFIGKDVLKKVSAEGVTRKLVGLRMIDRGIPRDGYPIIIGERKAGFVTSGTMSPSLNIAIGIGYVPVENAAIGNEILVDIRGQERKAEIVKTPFYKRR
jgi:aminomethyltransferase